ncbi:MAG TPA: phosphoenolpyruvate--protein phosphotransferase [Sedimenticola thiotaurini]|uniref:Phosphoenolpyruvate-protein phosphotransferase n=1 Tax=Sedimenticola thiotaurini TaxID=1543721 RepID=A0A831RQL0_9GAMM|nr:phosphoenolpyruvate--protein phosphotransferase [Sedimenticola thiotaurini]
MTFSCLGIGVGSGPSIAIGPAHLLHQGRVEVVPGQVERDRIPDEVDRFRQALAGARRTLRAVRSRIPANTRSDILAFIDTHLLMLEDAALAEAPIERIREQGCTAEWALQQQCDALTGVFDAMEDPYLRTRKDDVEHVVNQIQKILLQQQEEETEAEELQGRIVLARDLTPADTILLHHQGIAGFVTESGGPMSHTAILARSLGIPAVLGVHHAARCFRQGEQLVVDGHQGVVLAAVDQDTLSHYQGRIQAARDHASSLRTLVGQPACTRDGRCLTLLANIELPEDIDTTRSLQADGVGLYRTEYLFMNRSRPPDEEEHFAAYARVVEGLDGLPITIRTLDLGADKPADGDHAGTCHNPALGLRAVRLCLKEPDLFIPQLRAILRVAALGPVRMMIPMLCSLQEVAAIRTLVAETRRSLRRDGVAFDPDLPIGGMIEVPAAALAADAFARELDFLSIGTNDLVQYTLAIDRVDDEVNYLYDPLHPSVLQLIQGVIDAGHRQGIPVSMCGEMAGDPDFIPLLVGMGLQELSMQPGALLEAKQAIRSLHAGELEQQVRSLMQRIHEPEAWSHLTRLCRSIH